MFSFKEIRTPIIEESKLFYRSVGEDSDIVSKEMYTWKDLDNKNITLRPEYTAPVVRSFVQHNLGANSSLQRLYYIGPLFRRERPQKGRQRQFNQFGVEAFGSPHPEQDAEVISVGWKILEDLGLKNSLILKINSIGSNNCRKSYRSALKDFIRPNLDLFSITSQKRFKNNPLRILDSKSESEKILLEDAPKISDFYSDADEEHFSELRKYLKKMNIPFNIDTRLVRGLDYYTRTTFEITSDILGAQDAVLGGGRYDELVQTLGGKPTPAVGFAAGIERIIILMKNKKLLENKNSPDVYFSCLENNGLSIALSLSKKLRDSGIVVQMNTLRKSMKAQLREANKLEAKYAVILGDSEIKNKEVIIKNLKDGKQLKIAQSEMMDNFSDLT